MKSLGIFYFSGGEDATIKDCIISFRNLKMYVYKLGIECKSHEICGHFLA